MRMLTALIVLCVAAAPALAADPKPLRESSPTARQEMERFGTCVADRSPEKAAQTLAMDFRTPTYQSAMRNLTRANEDCFRRYRDAMRANNLSFAGAMAERLIERDATPINVRIARTAHVPVPPRTPSDAIAICIVRSAPDEVGKLFAADVASDGEQAAIKGLEFVTNLCSQGQPKLETTIEGLRAMLATAAFRVINATTTTDGAAK